MAEGFRPTFFAVFDDHSCVALKELFWDLGKLVDILTFDREAYACATHEDEHCFVKGLGVIDNNVAAVVTTGVIATKCFTSGHEGSHGWHDVHFDNVALEVFKGV